MQPSPRSLLVPALAATLSAAAPAQSWDQTLPIEDVETGLSCGAAATATVAAVGTPRFDPYNQPEIRDEVRVYELQSGAWVQVALLTSAEATPTSASYGRALALEGDLLAVGDPAAPGPGSITGAVHLYRRGPTGWELEQVVRPETLGLSSLEFGAALDLDGGRLAVGAPTSTVASGGLEDGSAYLFEPGPSGFAEAQRLDGPGGGFFSHFGRDLDLDGDLLAVGEPGGGTGGAVHLFDGATGSFAPLVTLEPALPTPGAGLGTSVALDGGTLAAGSPNVTLVNFADGRVHVFEGSGSAWTETATLEHVTGLPHERFGSDLASTSRARSTPPRSRRRARCASTPRRRAGSRPSRTSRRRAWCGRRR